MIKRPFHQSNTIDFTRDDAPHLLPLKLRLKEFNIGSYFSGFIHSVFRIKKLQLR